MRAAHALLLSKRWLRVRMPGSEFESELRKPRMVWGGGAASIFKNTAHPSHMTELIMVGCRLTTYEATSAHRHRPDCSLLLSGNYLHDCGKGSPSQGGCRSRQRK